MRLIVDIRSLNESSLTGVGYYTRSILGELCRIQDSRIKKIYLLSSGLFTKAEDLTVSKKFTHVESIHVNLPNKLLNILWSVGSYPRTIDNIRDANYLWLPNMNFLPRKLSIPYALTVHDISFLKNPSWFSPKQRLWHRAIRFRQLITKADKIITVSRYTKNDILALFPNIKDSSIRVIYPGLDTPLEQIKKSGQQIAIRPYLLYVGTVEPRKNITAILKAYEFLSLKRDMPDLIVIGKPGYKSKKILSNAHSKTIHYKLYVPDDEKQDLIAHASLLIWPSFYEGFGFPPVEASRCSVPVLTSYRSSIPEVMGMTAHYANPYNYKEIAHAIDLILKEGASLSNNQKALPIDQSWKKCCDELIDFFAK